MGRAPVNDRPARRGRRRERGGILAVAHGVDDRAVRRQQADDITGVAQPVADAPFQAEQLAGKVGMVHPKPRGRGRDHQELARVQADCGQGIPSAVVTHRPAVQRYHGVARVEKFDPFVSAVGPSLRCIVQHLGEQEPGPGGRRRGWAGTCGRRRCRRQTLLTKAGTQGQCAQGYGHGPAIRRGAGVAVRLRLADLVCAGGQVGKPVPAAGD